MSSSCRCRLPCSTDVSNCVPDACNSFLRCNVSRLGSHFHLSSPELNNTESPVLLLGFLIFLRALPCSWSSGFRTVAWSLPPSVHLLCPEFQVYQAQLIPGTSSFRFQCRWGTTWLKPFLLPFPDHSRL